ncbi:hypothetical protein [Desulfosarcina ovata]|uniref:Nickel transport protein n=2 Tax=Desulfosarcina ovata TaxID=83564 RepID=A0A5K8AJE6_9BACT|nr:hypothetical protein [Desulfosarcina ovata]BBO91794.1 hypothetical protein DSCOOX_49740 [Desulfosarcina ovata subsp. ovata]
MSSGALVSRLICTALLVMPFAFAGSALAHGTGFRLVKDPRPLAVRFYYTGGDPMGFAQVRVYSPESDAIEYQNGRTDGQGIFAFCPKRPGEWTLMVADGMGHKVRAVVQVGEGLNPAQATSRQGGGTKPGWLEIVAGLSLLMNIVLISGYLKKKKG